MKNELDLGTNPKYLAISHIRAKFYGTIPETVTVKECLELMLAFAEYESKRSTILEHQCQHLLAIKPTHCGNQSVEQRIRDLRFGIERIIEKTKYDEYGTFEDVRNRIIALASEVLAEDELPASEPWTPETARQQKGGTFGT